MLLVKIIVSFTVNLGLLVAQRRLILHASFLGPCAHQEHPDTHFLCIPSFVLLCITSWSVRPFPWYLIAAIAMRSFCAASSLLGSMTEFIQHGHRPKQARRCNNEPIAFAAIRYHGNGRTDLEVMQSSTFAVGKGSINMHATLTKIIVPFIGKMWASSSTCATTIDQPFQTAQSHVNI